MWMGLGLEEEKISKFLEVVGKIELHAAVILKFPLACWLSIRGLSERLEAALTLAHDPLHLPACKRSSNPSDGFSFSDFPFCSQPDKTLCF